MWVRLPPRAPPSFMIITCKQCLREFKSAQRKKSKTGYRIYCSKTCYYLSRSNKRHCKQCGSETTNPSFCSNNCAGSFNNKVYPKRIAKTKECKFCNKSIKGLKAFCNKNCYLSHRFNLKFDEIYAGKVTSRPTLKKFLIAVKGYVCWTCGNSKWLNKPIPLELDHINGKYQDNGLDNLRLLCPNCHALTSTYKARNKGNGRSYRRNNAAVA